VHEHGRVGGDGLGLASLHRETVLGQRSRRRQLRAGGDTARSDVLLLHHGLRRQLQQQASSSSLSSPAPPPRGQTRLGGEEEIAGTLRTWNRGERADSTLTTASMSSGIVTWVFDTVCNFDTTAK
jgi:hypothetical protein